MRKHLIKCFDERMVQPFPGIRARRAGSSSLININVKIDRWGIYIANNVH